MNSDQQRQPGREQVRREALRRLRQGRGAMEKMDQQDAKSLLHELEIHHVELQVQNEELRVAQRELADARDRYRDLYEYAPVGYLTLDLQGTVLEANLTATRLFGVDREDLLDKRVETVVESESRDACYLHLRQSQADEGTRTAELRCLRGGDDRFWSRWDTRTFPDNSAEPEGFRVAVFDIADRKEAERRLCELSEELTEKSRQLRKMVVELSTTEDQQRRKLADLLHDDLQQVLVGVRFHLGRVTQQWSEDPPEALEAADRLLGEAIGKTRRLSHQLDPPALREEGLEEGIRWLVDSIQQNQPLKVDIRSDGDLDDVCEPITRLVYKAVRELLLNVVKHAGVEQASLELKRLDGHLQVSVSDGGAGFECGGDGGPPVVGLGLATIRERAQALGGDLEIDSRPREGTRVTLRVPIRDPRVDKAREEVPAATKTEEGPRCDPGAKKIRIAIVDDHRVVREGLASLLSEQPDLEVVGEASTGVEAMDVIDEHRPDVVLMDFSMPEMSGEEATRRISRRWPGVRVVALSMFEEGFASQKMIEAGAEAYVPKAGHTDKLINIIRNGYGAK